MQYFWLNKKNNDNLIVFFCGWSFDYKPFESLDFGENDILVVFDYTNIEAFDIDLSEYQNKQLISWSMGVYVACFLRNYLPDFDLKIAINGTPFPIDNEYGIPQKTFDLTLKYVDTGLKGKFQQNLFKNLSDFELYLENPVQRSIENRANELVSLNSFINGREVSYSKFYDCAMISDADKIIPTRNQIRCWEKLDVPYVVLDNGHFPFFGFKSWKEIIDKCNQTLKK